MRARVRRRRHEPPRLARGKRFEAHERAGWTAEAGEELVFEQRVVDRRGRRGRIDIFVRSDVTLAGIGEVKATDWDKIPVIRVRALALRHARQIWRYIESHLVLGLDVSPGIIYPKPPRSRQKKRLVEQLLNDRLIQCAWRVEAQVTRQPRAR